MNDFRRNNRYGSKPSGSFGRKQSAHRPQGPMFAATCATCGKPTEVPFKPDGSRPIYCREHMSNLTFMSGRTPNPDRPIPKREYLQRRAFRTETPAAPRPAAPDPRIDEIQRTLEKLMAKLDQVLVSLAVSDALRSTKPVAAAKKKPAKKK